MDTFHREPQLAASQKTPPKLHKDRIGLGMATAVLSVFGLSTMNMFAKLLGDSHSIVEVAFYRNVIGLLPIVAMIVIFDRPEILRVQSRPGLLVLRSVIGSISLLVTFAAFVALPMADAQAFLFTSSLFVPILGYVFLSEKVGPYRWGAVIVGFLGMLIMVRPTGTGGYLGIALALSAAMMHSVLATLLRLLGRTERPETVAFYFMLIGAVLMGLAMPFVAKVPATRELLFFLGLGLSGGFAQLMLSVSYKYAPAALVTIFNYTGIVWGVAFGWFIWQDWPERAVWIGSAIIIASSVFIVWREQVRAKKALRATEDLPASL